MYKLGCEEVGYYNVEIYIISNKNQNALTVGSTSWKCSRFHLHRPSISTGSDHGVKAQGDGWVLTVALIEGVNIASLESTGFCDPYVVFTCNGKTRTSSVKLQSCDPQWNGIVLYAPSIQLYIYICTYVHFW